MILARRKRVDWLDDHDLLRHPTVDNGNGPYYYLDAEDSVISRGNPCGTVHYYVPGSEKHFYETVDECIGQYARSLDMMVTFFVRSFTRRGDAVFIPQVTPHVATAVLREARTLTATGTATVAKRISEWTHEEQGYDLPLTWKPKSQEDYRAYRNLDAVKGWRLVPM